ncbi:ubiquinone/menaquinone biosynthesis C-methylase UbiE [Kibdelosporangium banguiense]|uniref:Ubiquinone/menaquinone biosynthesis C-methylase UbiE n=1 Tax=Kibdelosporangium banguiense TaxID=1365924 RepID=A0ABS4T784_9PSEU|nr:methyltransferase domain-containing protein [Kibdelosporangium banguiense]MBP2320280.1 ubiquinone/menaquinone biosynthesis C-methylase UbiE [Kibdelosporangium banguiense]
MTSTEQGRRKYDELADRYEEIFPYVAEVGKLLVEHASPPSGARLLDVGAGRGAVARAALSLGCTVTAVDASQGMVERLACDFPDIEARQMDAGALAFPDASFDVVAAGFVIQVLPDPDVALAEAHRVLVPGGTIALSLEKQSVGRLRWLYELAAEYFGTPVPSDNDEDNGAVSSAQLDALLQAADFTNLATIPVEMPVSLANPPALWDWLTPRGLAEAVNALPAEQAESFRNRFLTQAETMQSNDGIALDFRATLHKAQKPCGQPASI